jgi:hypothetical protein
LTFVNLAHPGAWRNERMTVPKRKRRARRLPAAEPRPELKEAGGAQLGRDEERRPYRPRAEDASIEDPLRDWPEEE